ncbi:MAG: 2-succinyl-6-hydroxy-2,4-cyclohexadiene-1-carboxylate synthase [Caldithrix sp.]|nr:2-succinyl-6-hydroxy-2,4-cyclohexadiene-1-carboxylate synthase [Caldithrix sp.]
MLSLSFHYINNACKTTIVYLHGFMGRGSDWQDIINSLGKQVNHLTIDLPGHGQSLLRDQNVESLNYWQVVQQINDVIENHKNEIVHLIGYSMGGRFAWGILKQYSALINRAIIESAHPGLDEAEERAERKRWDEEVAERLLKEPLQHFIENWYQQPLFLLSKDDERLAQLIVRRLDNDAGQLAQVMRLFSVARQPSFRSFLHQVKQPLLYIAGEYDAKYVSIMRQLGQRNHYIQTMVIPGSGHNTHLQNREEFVQSVRSFLNLIQH